MTRQERLEQLKQQREAERQRIRDEKIQAEVMHIEEMLSDCTKKADAIEAKWAAFKEQAAKRGMENYI